MDTEARTPPPYVSLLWCPVCGRDDRLTHLRHSSPHNSPMGKRCPGAVVTLRYVLQPDA